MRTVVAPGCSPIRGSGPRTVVAGNDGRLQPGRRRLSGRWRLMLKVGDSFGLATHENRLVASGLTVPFHSQFGWISMILVTAPFRRRGLATHLMGRCIAALRARGLVPALDLTPEGARSTGLWGSGTFIE